MPQYKQSALPSDWTDPKRASVFDPLYKRAIRGILSTFGAGEPETALETAMPTPLAPVASVVTTLGKRIAPKRAAKELADLLLGRSKRVPPIQPMTDAEASIAALMHGKAGKADLAGTILTRSQPPPPLELRTGKNGLFAGSIGNREIKRAPGLNDLFKQWQRVKGAPVERRVRRTVDPSEGNRLRVAEPPTKELAKRAGSVQAAAKGTTLKIKTEHELQGLLEGPRKAVKMGHLTPKEANKILAANKQKIDDYFTQLKQLDKTNYDQAMQDRINKRFQLFAENNKVK